MKQNIFKCDIQNPDGYLGFENISKLVITNISNPLLFFIGICITIGFDQFTSSHFEGINNIFSSKPLLACLAFFCSIIYLAISLMPLFILRATIKIQKKKCLEKSGGNFEKFSTVQNILKKVDHNLLRISLRSASLVFSIMQTIIPFAYTSILSTVGPANNISLDSIGELLHILQKMNL